MRKILSVVLTVILLLSTVISVTAESNTKHEQQVKVDMDRMSEKYGIKIKQIDEFPDGIKPVNYESVKEFEEYLIEAQEYFSKLEKEPIKITIDADKSNHNEGLDTGKNNNPSVLRSATQGSQQSYKYIPPSHRLYIGATYTYDSNFKRFISCQSVNSWVTGIQFPFGYTWDQTQSYYNIIDTNRHLYVSATGVLGYYFVVDGIGHFYSATHTITAEFSIN